MHFTVSRHSGRPHYGRGDTWRWFTPPFGPDLSLPLQRLHWVSGKAFIAIIPVSRCHGNTLCYVILNFFFISSSGAQLLASLHRLSMSVLQALCADRVTTGQMCQYVGRRISKTDARDQWLGQMTIVRYKQFVHWPPTQIEPSQIEWRQAGTSFSFFFSNIQAWDLKVPVKSHLVLPFV